MEMKILWIIFVYCAIFSDVESQVSPTLLCNFNETINIASDNGGLDQDGRYHHNGLIYEPGMFGYFDYYYDNYTTKIPTQPHYRGCICMLKNCIRICRFCDEDEDADWRCVKTRDKLKVKIDGDKFRDVSLTDGTFGILEGKSCKVMFKLEPTTEDDQYYEDEWVFEDNGNIKDRQPDLYNHNQFCFVQNEDGNGSYTTEALACYEPLVEKVEERVYPFGMLISLPFLLVTFFVFGCIPELRNLHGKCLMCYIVGLMTFYIGLITVNWEDSFLSDSFPCIFFGYMIYIGIQLCFFWLNVMCFDIWSAFKVGMRQRGSERKRFAFYCLYAFGVPITFTLLVSIIDSIEAIGSRYRPQIGQLRCYIKKSNFVEAVYVYIPISIILTINIILYSVTAYTIYRVQKETAVVRNSESQKHSARMETSKNRFFPYLSLFIIMGVTWIMEALSFVSSFFLSPPPIFILTDILNCLQGVVIFFLFVWKPKVKKLVVKRYRSLRGLPPVAAQSNLSNTETSKLSMSMSSAGAERMKTEKSISHENEF